MTRKSSISYGTAVERVNAEMPISTLMYNIKNI